MVDHGSLLSWFPYIFVPFFTFLLFFCNKSSSSSISILPKSYPLIGSSFAILANSNRYNQWVAGVLNVFPTNTYVLRIRGASIVTTAYPENLKHILKSHFSNYPKGGVMRNILSDFLGNGIFNSDGDNLKFQRKISSHEFNTTSLRKFIEEVVKIEIFHRLIPVLSMTSEKNSEIDLEDILQRFAFDNICKISFGYDPNYLSISLEKTEFSVAFEDATRIISERTGHIIHLVWKLKRFLNIGSEKRLKQATATIRESARKIVRQKKHELKDSYTYPVFQAGPRICLGKEMAFLQMKMVAVEVLRRFHVVPIANKNDAAPVYISYLTSKMKGGFPVKIEKRPLRSTTKCDFVKK